MISLTLSASSDAHMPFVTRLGRPISSHPDDSLLHSSNEHSGLWSGPNGLFEIEHQGVDLAGDVVLIYPNEGRAERLIRAHSQHNTLLVTEQCDQLCIMCSQPPKKTHIDRFDLLEKACLLAPGGMTIGISGGEPTLHMDRLLDMLEAVLAKRGDLTFHVLSNGQHFERKHALRLRNPAHRRVTWGIPLYSSNPATHDAIVAKPGAFERLIHSLEHLIVAGTRIELRTVLTSENLAGLDNLARFIASNLPHIEQWSIMGLENIGFARTRFGELRVVLPRDFQPIAQALDRTALHGIPAKLFNIPLCHIPEAYRGLAVASISDWKQRFATACTNCSAKPDCAGFFEWHPDELIEEVSPL